MTVEEKLNDVESKLDYLIGLIEDILAEQPEQTYDDDGFRERNPLTPL